MRSLLLVVSRDLILKAGIDSLITFKVDLSSEDTLGQVGIGLKT
jgi:hypothetical protein